MEFPLITVSIIVTLSILFALWVTRGIIDWLNSVHKTEDTEPKDTEL